MDIKCVKIQISLKKLEELKLRTDFLSSTANICGAAFDKEDSMSILDHKSIQETFFSINRQTADMSEQLEDIINNLLDIHGMCIQESRSKNNSDTQSNE